MTERGARAAARIVPVLLSGGTGTRLWPLSRQARPKQLLPLAGAETLLQQAALRTADHRFARPMVIANADHRFVIAEQLRALGGPPPRIVLEPFGRNTTPAATVAALLAVPEDPGALLLLTPADHVVGDPEAFRRAVDIGAVAARQGALVLFGLRPTAPATGYGYIRIGSALDGAAGVHRVDAFVEKPDRPTAERYIVSGDHLWNSGIFLLPAQVLLDEVERLEPAVLAACRAAVDGASRDADFTRLDPAAFALCPSISLDYAVMERTARAAVVPAGFAWTDVGSWSALYDIAARDAEGNVAVGAVLAERTRGSYLHADGTLVAALGVEDLIVVATPDAVLIARRGDDQDVRRIVERLKSEGRDELL